MSTLYKTEASYNIIHQCILFVFRPIHTQRIPANVKDVIIGDINGDGSTELVISLTDRVVSTDQSEASKSETVFVFVGEDL